MSEPVAAAVTSTPEPAAASGDPIEAAIASSIADIRPSEPADDSEPESGTAPASAPPAAQQPPPSMTETPAAPAAPKVEVNELDALIDAEMGAGHGKRKDNRIPYQRTVKIVENAVAKAKATWQAEQETTLKPQTEKIADYERRVTEFESVERLIESDADKFMANLAEAYPQYRKYLGPLPSNERPTPDITLPDGRKVYSDEAQAKLEAWQGKQYEQALAKRLEPLEKEQKQKAIIESLRPGVSKSIEEANKWPLWQESQKDILAALQADEADAAKTGRRMQTHAEIYIKTVIPKLVADRTKMREELLAEQNARPHTTATTPTAARPPESAEPKDLEDIIRASIRKT